MCIQNRHAVGTNCTQEVRLEIRNFPTTAEREKTNPYTSSWCLHGVQLGVSCKNQKLQHNNTPTGTVPSGRSNKIDQSKG